MRLTSHLRVRVRQVVRGEWRSAGGQVCEVGPLSSDERCVHRVAVAGDDDRGAQSDQGVEGRGPLGQDGVAEQAQAENVLTQALGKLFAVAEAYPQLRATENFQKLQDELSDTESKIAVSRQVYNDTVLTYDNAIETVPSSLVAGTFGFERKPFFEVEDAARTAPRVAF